MTKVIEEIKYQGTPICPGIAIGMIVNIDELEEEVDETTLSKAEVEEEVNRFRRAVERSCEDLVKLQDQLENESIFEGAVILDTHLQIMQDPVLTSTIEYNIRSTQRNAEYVFTRVIQETETKFEAIEDPFFRERSKDVHDVSRRVMGHLKEKPHVALDHLPNNSIVLVQELLASEVAEAPGNILGFMSKHGGTTSHAAIMARAKGLPGISNVDYAALKVHKDCLAIMDGNQGVMIINPTPETLQKYKDRQKLQNLQQKSLEDSENVEAETYDGYKVRLCANIDMDHEVDLLHQYGGHGVGLFRSESIFIMHKALPNEEEQFETYRKIILKMKGLPIVIRAFDIGGDKGPRCHHFTKELNPFLGCRAIRFLLKEKIIFKTQLRAILRASVLGNVSIMFPMITSLSELLEAKMMLERAKDELKSEGVKLPSNIRVGCMIEVPSAAIIADLLAQECDFLSIGTNDLIQYALAVDRGNTALSAFYTPAHPGVLRLIKMVVTEANRRGKPVSVCGEMAADPKYTQLLLGLGVHELSVASRCIPAVKHAIRSASIVEASLLAETALTMRSTQDIQALLE